MQTIHKVVAALVAALALTNSPTHAQEERPVPPPPTTPPTTLSDDAIVRSAMRPPGISLDISDATPGEVVAGLNKALGAPMMAGQGISFAQNTSRSGRIAGSSGATAGPGVRFTLKCDNMPLWEVLKQLDRQTAIGVKRDPMRAVIDIARPNVAGRPVPLIGDPMKFFSPVPDMPALALRARIFNFSDRPENWTLQLTMLTDPRARICRGLIVIKTVTDNEGKNFEIPASSAKDIAPSVGEYQQNFKITRSFSDARKAKVTGEAHVWVVLEEERRELGDLNDNQGKPIEMKGGTVTFQKVRLPPGADPPVVLRSSLTRSTPASQEQWPVEFCTTSSNGTVIAGLAGGASGRISGGGALAIPTGQLTVNWVLRAKEIVTPFEIPDVTMESQ